MGYEDSPAFLAAFQAHSEGVRALSERIHARLGAESGGAADELRAAILLADTPDGEEGLRRALENREFPEPEESLRALVGLAVGPVGYPHPASTRRLFGDLAPNLLDACAAAADPARALAGVRDFADRKLLHRSLFQTMREHPSASGGLARFAGAAPWGMRVVLRYPELADVITDEELLQRAKNGSALRNELAARLDTAASHAQRLSTLRRFKLRELVRLAARHVLAPVAVETETREWSDVADALLAAALETAVRQLRETDRWPRGSADGFAVFALGRYGGRDLHFASDLDLLYISGGEGALPRQEYELLARELSDVLQTVAEEGKLYDLDLRLRPEGRQGFSVTSLEAARRYYGEGGRGETWELQMLTRLRAVAGDPATAAAFEAFIRPRVFRHPMPEQWTADIAAMKRRIERERVSDADRDRHLKLGPGGLSDIEFLTQYLQLRHGASVPALQVTGTLEALGALARHGLIATEEADALTSAYRLLTRTRQSLSLLQPDGPSDLVPPPDAGRPALALARALGFGDADALHAELALRKAPVRSLLLRRLA
jgi:glutamate-ammonia-ligase adenylyltransferase